MISGIGGINLVSGALAGSLTNLIFVPTDVLSQKSSVNTMNGKNSWAGNCYRNSKFTHADVGRTARSLGFFGLYRGFWFSLMAGIPASSIAFSTYEISKTVFNERFGYHVRKLTKTNKILVLIIKQ